MSNTWRLLLDNDVYVVIAYILVVVPDSAQNLFYPRGIYSRVYGVVHDILAEYLGEYWSWSAALRSWIISFNMKVLVSINKDFWTSYSGYCDFFIILYYIGFFYYYTLSIAINEQKLIHLWIAFLSIFII